MVAGILSGCASSGNYEKGSTAGAGLNEAANNITAGKGKIDAALTILNDLINSSPGDLKPKFNKFNDAVVGAETSASGASGQSVKMSQ